MPNFQGHWFSLELDRVTLYPLIELRAWIASTPLPSANGKGYHNTTHTPVHISRSTTYALLVQVDSNDG